MKDMTLSEVTESSSDVRLRLRPIRRSNQISELTEISCTQNAVSIPASSGENTIEALLQRTNTALDRIIEIRESLEPLVDFRQFQTRTSGRNRNHRRRYSVTTESSGAQIQDNRTHKSDTNLLQSCPDIFVNPNPQFSHPSSHSSNESFPIFHRSFDSRDSADDATVSTEQSVLDESDEMQFDQNDSKEGSCSEASESERCSTLSTTEDFDVEKERSRRLDRIQVQVYENLPREFFHILGRFLVSTIEVKLQHSRFSFYKEAFTGAECICQLIVNGFASDQPTAIRYGNVLIKLGFIEHVTHMDDQLQRDHFYRFSKQLQSSQNMAKDPESGTRHKSIDTCNQEEEPSSEEYDLSQASDKVYALLSGKVVQILQRVLHRVLERKNKLLYYKGFAGCFIAAEGVELFQNLGIADNMVDAILIKQALLNKNLIQPVASNLRVFQHRCVFYRLTTLELDC